MSPSRHYHRSTCRRESDHRLKGLRSVGRRLAPRVGEQGYYVGEVEGNLYRVTDGIYQCVFMTTCDGVVLFDAPPTIGRNIQRAVDDIALAYGVTDMKWTHLIDPHHHADHTGASSLVRPGASFAVGAPGDAETVAA